MNTRELRPAGRLAPLFVLLLCGCPGDPPPEPATGSASAQASSGDDIAPGLPAPGRAPSASPSSEPRRLVGPTLPPCTAEMVSVPGGGELASFCIDRYEAVIKDDKSGIRASPYYPPEPNKARYLEKLWREQRGGGTALEQSLALPELPLLQRQPSFVPRAASERGLVPAAYVSGKDAALACKTANKRLCTREEWKRACRGQQDRQFPYGDHYEQGRCNVFRETHPGVLLYENPSINHTDPRFNLVRGEKGPLLRITGGTLLCKSEWGDDAIFDMVGNLDEWIDDPEGTFLGGFYARGKKDGCDSAVEAHGFTYADYSTGFRCCAAAAGAALQHTAP